MDKYGLQARYANESEAQIDFVNPFVIFNVM